MEDIPIYDHASPEIPIRLTNLMSDIAVYMNLSGSKTVFGSFA